MLVFVPQGYVALVYENGALRTAVEAGVGFLAPARGQTLEYVELQPQYDQEAAELATLH